MAQRKLRKFIYFTFNHTLKDYGLSWIHNTKAVKIINKLERWNFMKVVTKI